MEWGSQTDSRSIVKHTFGTGRFDDVTLHHNQIAAIIESLFAYRSDRTWNDDVFQHLVLSICICCHRKHSFGYVDRLRRAVGTAVE